MFEMKPFFSIIVPCCDVEPYVRECLDSILHQPFADWECLIGVETSKDRTEEIVREYVARDQRFKMTIGPRSGSPSTPRNTGLAHAQGEYVIFLDGDDAIVDGALQQLHDLIVGHPGADLYPSAIRIQGENGERCASEDVVVHDNYDRCASAELTGGEAILFLERRWHNPFPMAQMTIYRRTYLLDHALHFVPGLKQEDSEFLPRVLYYAKKVVPIHFVFYTYYKGNPSSISHKSQDSGRLQSYARVYRSLLSFYADVSKEKAFDRRIAESWARAWTGKMFTLWFEMYIDSIPRTQRWESLKVLFSDGFDSFRRLIRHASSLKRFAAWWMLLAVRHPSMAGLCEAFFSHVYFPLLNFKKRLKT